MENERQEVISTRNKDKLLEAQIGLSKGWWKAKTKHEMALGFRRMANLKARRSSEQLRELEYLKFGFSV